MRLALYTVALFIAGFFLLFAGVVYARGRAVSERTAGVAMSTGQRVLTGARE
jgi:hypothetical protein